MGQGKELSKALVLAGDWLQPDPLGSSGAQTLPQSSYTPGAKGAGLLNLHFS